MTTAAVAPGQSVLYNPDPVAYGLNVDDRGNPLFELTEPKTGKPFSWPKRKRAGQPYRGPKPSVGKPLVSWHAVVFAAYADGTADLEIFHPMGHKLFHRRVAQGNETTPNTWTLPGAK